MTVEFDTPVRTQDADSKIFLDQHYDEGAWLSLHTKSGSMYAVLTKEQIGEMIRRLTLIAEAL